MTDKSEIEKLKSSLKEIESRILRLESVIDAGPVTIDQQKQTLPSVEPTIRKREEGAIESKIGEYGMAWIGNIVLLFGILFLLQILNNQDYRIFSSITGFASVIGIYLLGQYLKKRLPYMSTLFTYNGHILLFIVTLSLHYSTSDPLIKSDFAGISLLIIVVAALCYLAYRNKSQLLSGIGLVMIFTTALVSNSTHVMLPLMIITSILSVFYLQKFGWNALLIVSIFLVYITFLLWFFNNPFITHSLEAIGSIQGTYIYILICALLYTIVALLPSKDKINEAQINVSIILNGLGFSMIMTLICVNFFKDNYYIILGIISAYAIIFSAVLQARGNLKISPALYALYGFAVLSITLAGLFQFPLAFLLLSVESLLVLSMALWFRSRFIVAMNLLMYIGLLTAYIISHHSMFGISLSFALVALVSARVINWKKDRLEIKTELIRNIYLIIGFIMTLLSLYIGVPPHYVTFSWAMAAGLFFTMSLILRNVKYRWLAITAMIGSAVYFFLFDLRHISIGYRVLALLVIAIISLSFSSYYARKMKLKKEEEK